MDNSFFLRDWVLSLIHSPLSAVTMLVRIIYQPLIASYADRFLSVQALVLEPSRKTVASLCKIVVRVSS